MDTQQSLIQPLGGGLGKLDPIGAVAASITNTSNSRADYVAAKNGQIAQYRARAKWYRARVLKYSLGVTGLVLLAGFLLLTLGGMGDAGLLAGLIFAALAAIAIYAMVRLRRNDLKSAILLDQFVTELERALNDTVRPLPAVQQEVLRIETNFLNNDDELYTKKYIWQPYLVYLYDKADYYAAGGKNSGRIEPHPAHYISRVPAVWMQESPIELTNDDSDFVYQNWAIKRKVRSLYWAFYGRKADTLTQISEIAQGNPVVYERMLRNKKISKGLKVFKRQAWIRYLTPAAKMKLVSFVDSVLQERPYVEQCDSMADLLLRKDVQIKLYEEDFWKIHRRSLKFYALEVLGALLVIPLIIGSFAAGVSYGLLAGSLVFILGGAAIVYGEMALVTTQMRDLKAKKQTPNLVSSLIAIRHNVGAEPVLDDDVVYQHERAFKAAEKRFMLTTTEIEPVKAAKENVSDRVLTRLNAQMIQLRTNKEAQAQVYYEKFNHYRRMCLKFGALEAFVALLWVPVAISTLLTGALGLLLGATIIAIVTEAVAIHRHIIVARRKELYLLIYQKMAVLLSDYRLFGHPRYIAAELTSLEDSVRRAAALDNIIDVDEHIGDISAVDLGMFDEDMWDRIEFMQVEPSGTGIVPNPEATLSELTGNSRQV